VPTERPQGILQAFGQRHIALAAEHDLDMFEPGTGQRKMIQPVLEALTADDDPEIAHLGEIGQPHAAGLLDLAKHDVLVGAVQGFPFRHPPLQRASERRPDTIGIAPRQFIEQAERTQPRGRLQHHNDLLVPQPSQRIGTGRIASPLLLGARQPRIMLDPPAGRHRQSGFGGGGHLGVVGASSHVEPHLLVVDVSACHLALRSSEHTRPVRTAGEENASVEAPASVGLRPPDASASTAHPN